MRRPVSDRIAERPERIGQRRAEPVAGGGDAKLPVEIFDLPAAFNRVFHQVERGAAGILEVGVRLPQPRELRTAGAERVQLRRSAGLPSQAAHSADILFAKRMPVECSPGYSPFALPPLSKSRA